MPSAHLYQKARQWDQKARQWENAINPRDRYGYVDLLDEITFHAELRYGDYVQLQGQGPFSAHLERWLDNLTNEHQQQALLRVFDHLTFIDNDQMLALYRDAFRRIISAWMMPESTIDAMLAVDYNLQRLRALAEYQIATITQSCDAGLLLKANDLGGLRRPVLLGPSPRLAQAAILALGDKTKGLIVCEDIVGTGRQANRVLKAVETHRGGSWKNSFKWNMRN